MDYAGKPVRQLFEFTCGPQAFSLEESEVIPFVRPKEESGRTPLAIPSGPLLTAHRGLLWREVRSRSGQNSSGEKKKTETAGHYLSV